METTEKRLKIDISVIKQALEKGELQSISWVPGKCQLADCLTKINKEAAEALQKYMREGELLINLSEGVTRAYT